jgi:REP element-mobilizing transposase RayT
VVESFHYFDGQRYQLGDYVIMPNHVHVLMTPSPGFQLKPLLQTWKSFTAKKMQKLDTSVPVNFWQHESYDHIVRSPRQLSHYQNYIRENPSKACLKDGEWTHWEAPKQGESEA